MAAVKGETMKYQLNDLESVLPVINAEGDRKEFQYRGLQLRKRKKLIEETLLTPTECFFSAKEAKKWGIVDEIIEKY